MPRRLTLEAWECPVCGVAQGISGKPFLSSRAVSLHVAGKAKNQDVNHQEQIRAWIPFVNFGLWTNNEIAEQIVEFVQDTEAAEAEEPATLEDETVALPDAQYHLLKETEVGLHNYIRRRLKEQLGSSEDEWWAQGVPQTVRLVCVQRRETDTRRQDAFVYTDLIDLKQILDRNWIMFEQDMKAANEFFPNKRDLLDGLQRLNEIRNVVMHPVRNQDPARGDLDFVGWMHRGIRMMLGPA
jgi:hypothetical protein